MWPTPAMMPPKAPTEEKIQPTQVPQRMYHSQKCEGAPGMPMKPGAAIGVDLTLAGALGGQGNGCLQFAGGGGGRCGRGQRLPGRCRFGSLCRHRRGDHGGGGLLCLGRLSRGSCGRSRGFRGFLALGPDEAGGPAGKNEATENNGKNPLPHRNLHKKEWVMINLL